MIQPPLSVPQTIGHPTVPIGDGGARGHFVLFWDRPAARWAAFPTAYSVAARVASHVQCTSDQSPPVQCTSDQQIGRNVGLECTQLPSTGSKCTELPSDASANLPNVANKSSSARGRKHLLQACPKRGQIVPWHPRPQRGHPGTRPHRGQSGAWHPRPRRGQNVPWHPRPQRGQRSRTRRAKPAPKRANAQEEPRLRPPALPPLGTEREARSARRPAGDPGERREAPEGFPAGRFERPKGAIGPRGTLRGLPVGSDGSKDYASFSTARMMAL